jgi:chromosomal replication initiator protein
MDTRLAALWENVLAEMKPKISSGNYAVLFKPTYLLSLADDIATVAAPNTMIINLLNKRFLTDIKILLDSQTGKDLTVLFVPRAPLPAEKKHVTEEGPLFSEEKVQAKPMVGHLPRVRPEYTFSNFAVSSSNQLAFVSATTVAKQIGRSYNPLFIYGPVGVGKTHLMHAIANQAYQEAPEKKIIYITSEEFTNEVIEAIRNNDTAKMKKRFRSAYVLLIDDIQFIEGKDKVQEELFHTFNILIDNQSQIVLSSDRPPHEIKRLEKRLSSRFAGGLTVDVEKPDIELKTAILQKKAEKYGHELPTDVAMSLAEQAEDTRSLEGLLLRVITQAATTNTSITMASAQNAMGTVSQKRSEHIYAEDVINAVCEYFHIKTTQLKGPKRDASLVKARQLAMYLLKHELSLTLVEIGNLLGGRDHTTIKHGVDKIEDLVEKKAAVFQDISGITKAFRG